MSRALDRHRLQSQGTWWLAGAEPLRSIQGTRHSWVASPTAEGKNPSYGAISIGPDELPHALAAIRGVDAVVIGLPANCNSDGIVRDVASQATDLFESACTLLSTTAIFVARGFGVFDDPESGVDVVATSTFIDRLLAPWN